MTVLRCRTKDRHIITRYSGHIGFAERMKRIRHHYKKFHPNLWGKIKTRIKKTKTENPNPIPKVDVHTLLPDKMKDKIEPQNKVDLE